MDINQRQKELEREKAQLAIRKQQMTDFIKILDEELEDFRKIDSQKYE